MQSFDSSESSESLQGLSSYASCSAPTTSAASRPMSKQKSADANDLGVDDPKRVRLRAFLVSIFEAQEKILQGCLVSESRLVGISCQV